MPLGQALASATDDSRSFIAELRALERSANRQRHSLRHTVRRWDCVRGNTRAFRSLRVVSLLRHLVVVVRHFEQRLARRSIAGLFRDYSKFLGAHSKQLGRFQARIIVRSHPYPPRSLWNVQSITILGCEP